MDKSQYEIIACEVCGELGSATMFRIKAVSCLHSVFVLNDYCNETWSFKLHDFMGNFDNIKFDVEAATKWANEKGLEFTDSLPKNENPCPKFAAYVIENFMTIDKE